MMHDCDYKPGFCSYEQTIAQLRDDLLYIQKLQDEVNAFREMLPCLDKRSAVLSTVGSMLKIGFGTATLLDVEKLHRTVDEMHRTEGDTIHSVNYQMTYSKSFDFAV